VDGLSFGRSEWSEPPGGRQEDHGHDTPPTQEPRRNRHTRRPLRILRSVFGLDFRSIGGSLVGTPDTTVLLSICPNTLVVAAASAGWDDSVHVALNPCTDHGRVILDGKWRGGEIRGRWYESTTGGSSGTFTMHRASA